MDDDLQSAPPLPMSALKGLAHPLRVQIVDALSAYGPATASALADRLGESSGATSYHLRQLEKHGFVREDATRGTGRERWWERMPRAINLDVDADADPAERSASDLVIGEWQRTRNRRLAEFLAHRHVTFGAEWAAAGTNSTVNLPLTREQTADLAAELIAVVQSYRDRYRGQRAEGARPVEIHVDVFALIDGVVQRPDVGGAEESKS